MTAEKIVKIPVAPRHDKSHKNFTNKNVSLSLYIFNLWMYFCKPHLANVVKSPTNSGFRDQVQIYPGGKFMQTALVSKYIHF